ncbi:predicted protein [Histoplasma capsulatum G186AR]|uniref:Uncharacterized protein n=1 Tax=Ajellomyces capsulatus (strain G186AR / H82 / ATCC MYA-2454 / RMSCC 2432) TaxID=447093 RepID=C0NBS5_AJECG|nr:uncharacterized protein HCBG_00571 [Histoplasma capsulatum G186AR]EEH11116.1 predicted protein [Histoplasma capsulatum G186AR]
MGMDVFPSSAHYAYLRVRCKEQNFSTPAPGAYGLAQPFQIQSVDLNRLAPPQSSHLGTPSRQQMMCAEVPETVRPAGSSCCAWWNKHVEHGTDRGLSSKLLHRTLGTLDGLSHFPESSSPPVRFLVTF